MPSNRSLTPCRRITYYLFSLFSLNCRHDCGNYVTGITCVPCLALCNKHILVTMMVIIMRRATCINDCMTIQYYLVQPGPLICVVRVINRGTVAYHSLHISRKQWLFFTQIVLKMCRTEISNHHVTRYHGGSFLSTTLCWGNGGHCIWTMFNHLNAFYMCTYMYIHNIWGLCCRKQVSEAWINNCIP